MRRPVTAILISISEPQRECTLEMDTAYTVLDLIIDLKKYDEKLGIYSLYLPVSGRVDPSRLRDAVHPQLRAGALHVRVFHPVNYCNSFCVINHLLGLHEHELLETTNLMDVDPINHAKLGEWIGFGSGPTTIPPEDDNTLPNLIWVAYKHHPPFCYNVHGLHRLYANGGGNLLIPHLNRRIKPAKFLSACQAREPFRVVRIDDEDMCTPSQN